MFCWPSQETLVLRLGRLARFEFQWFENLEGSDVSVIFPLSCLIHVWYHLGTFYCFARSTRKCLSLGGMQSLISIDLATWEASMFQLHVSYLVSNLFAPLLLFAGHTRKHWVWGLGVLSGMIFIDVDGVSGG